MAYWRTEEDIEEMRKYCTIGKNCKIVMSSIIDGRRESGWVYIGNNTTITEYVTVLCHDAAPYHAGLPIVYRDTVIGDNCFIGIRTIILPGVMIGNNVIVGAGSVVTKDIPSGQVWAGNPAKFIKTIEEMRAEHEKAKKVETVKEETNVFDIMPPMGPKRRC